MKQSGRTSIPKLLPAAMLVVSAFAVVYAHDVTTHVSWNREVSRIVYARCAACHRPGGRAFSLLSYQEASPWAIGIREQVLQRKMPPWGAVKGFGSFRNDQTLTQEEMDLIQAWVNGGAPEGNPNDLPARPRILLPPTFSPRSGEIVASAGYTFQKPFTLDGFWATDQHKGGYAQITITFPDGRTEPLVWFHDYAPQSDHPFLLRAPLQVPRGSVIRGLLPGTSLVLIPAIASR